MVKIVERERAGPGTTHQKEETIALREKWNQEREATKRQKTTTTGEAVGRLQADQQHRQKEVVGLEGLPAEQDQVVDLLDPTDLIDLTELTELIELM